MSKMLESGYKGLRLTVAGTILTAGFLASPEAVSASVPQPSQPVSSELCGENNIPKTPASFFCKDRRIGILGVVVMPGLKVKDPFISYDKESVLEVANYATDTLREVSGGIIDLTPQIIYAPKKVEDEIRSHNAGYRDGRECTDLFDGQNLMGKVIKEYMPETNKLANTVILGGDACASGFMDLYGIAGYEPTRRYVDLYNSNARKPEKGSSYLTKLGGLMAHEISHNLGLNHAGTIYLDEKTTMADASKEVDLPKMLMDGKIKAKKHYYYFFNQYGDQGNLMSSNVYPLTKDSPYKPHNLTNALQQEYIRNDTEKENTGYKKMLQPLLLTEQFTLKNYDKNAPKGVSVPLSNKGYEIDKFKFTTISFEPVYANGQAYLNTTLSTQGQDLLLTTAKLGAFAISSEKPRIFKTQAAIISAQKGVFDEVIFKVEPLV